MLLYKIITNFHSALNRFSEAWILKQEIFSPSLFSKSLYFCSLEPHGCIFPVRSLKRFPSAAIFKPCHFMYISFEWVYPENIFPFPNKYIFISKIKVFILNIKYVQHFNVWKCYIQSYLNKIWIIFHFLLTQVY